jgi:hypothetical protein
MRAFIVEPFKKTDHVREGEGKEMWKRVFVLHGFFTILIDYSKAS